MKYKITVIGQKTFDYDAAAGGSLLDQMLQKGISISYMCKDGFCNQCRCKKTKGEVNVIKDIILDDEKNFILACSSQPTSDLVVQPENR